MEKSLQAFKGQSHTTPPCN